MTTIPESDLSDYGRGWRDGHNSAFNQVHDGLRTMRPGYHTDTCPCSACGTIDVILRHFAPDAPVRQLPTLEEALALALASESIKTDSDTGATA